MKSAKWKPANVGALAESKWMTWLDDQVSSQRRALSAMTDLLNDATRKLQAARWVAGALAHHLGGLVLEVEELRSELQAYGVDSSTLRRRRSPSEVTRALLDHERWRFRSDPREVERLEARLERIQAGGEVEDKPVVVKLERHNDLTCSKNCGVETVVHEDPVHGVRRYHGGGLPGFVRPKK